MTINDFLRHSRSGKRVTGSAFAYINLLAHRTWVDGRTEAEARERLYELVEARLGYLQKLWRLLIG